MKTINNKLENFDVESLDMFEEMQYNDYVKHSTKVEALQILINTVEGDFSQLSEGLAEIVEEQKNLYDKN